MIKPIMTWINDKEEQLLGGDSNNARFMRSTFWLTSSTVISLMLSMVSSIAVARMLNKTAFGEFGMVINTIAMLGTFTGLGLGLTSNKFIAEFKVKDPAKASRIMKLTNHMALLSGGLVSVFIFLFADYISAHILNAPYLSNKLRMGTILLFLNTLNGTQTGALSGLESFKTITKINTIRGVINAPVLIIATYFFGLSGAVTGVVMSGFAGWALNHIALDQECKKFNLPKNSGNIYGEFNVLWKFSLPALISGALFGPIIWLANTILVNKPGGYGELGLVNAANQWKNLIFTLPSILCSAALPILSSAQHNLSEGSETLDVTQKVTIAIVLPLYTITIFLGNAIMSLYGKSFIEGYPVLVWITFAVCLMAIANVGGTVLVASGKMWLDMFNTLMWGIVMTGYVYLFSGSGGAKAYAIGFALAHATLSFLLLWYLRNIFNKKTVLLTILSIIYLLVITFIALNISKNYRLFLASPLFIFSIFMSYLVLGKSYSSRIYAKINSAFLKKHSVQQVSGS